MTGEEEERKTFTWSKTGTLPTLERLLEEMATLEEQQLELKVGTGGPRGFLVCQVLFGVIVSV